MRPDGGVRAVRENEPSSDVLVTEAALAAFEAEGLGGVTLRSVAQRAGVPPATVQRRFQTKERLLQAVMAAFVEREIVRLRETLSAVGEARPPIEALPYLLCAELEAADRPASRVMLIEFLTAAARDPSFRPLARTWFESAERCWKTVVGEDSYAGSLAAFMVELHVALTLESIGCDDALKLQLANLEVAQIALLGPGAAPRFWFRKLLSAAEKERETYPHAATTEEARAILDAGSDLLVSGGSEAISFRSVAAQAGATFSSVASIFRRKEILLSSICDHLVARAMTIAPPPLTGPRDLAKICEITCDMLTSGGRFYGQYYFLGAVELRMLAARNPRFANLAWRLRMMNGLYELRKDDPTYDEFGLDAFAVHARACWSHGVGLIQTATQPPELLQPKLLERLNGGAPCFEVRRPAHSRSMHP